MSPPRFPISLREKSHRSHLRAAHSKASPTTRQCSRAQTATSAVTCKALVMPVRPEHTYVWAQPSGSGSSRVCRGPLSPCEIRTPPRITLCSRRVAREAGRPRAQSARPAKNCSPRWRSALNSSRCSQASSESEFHRATYAVFHTGPSATGDGEGVLIHGAQEVRTLTVAFTPRLQPGRRAAAS